MAPLARRSPRRPAGKASRRPGLRPGQAAEGRRRRGKRRARGAIRGGSWRPQAAGPSLRLGPSQAPIRAPDSRAAPARATARRVRPSRRLGRGRQAPQAPAAVARAGMNPPIKKAAA